MTLRARSLSLVFILMLTPSLTIALSSGADFLRAEIPARAAALGGAFVAWRYDPAAFLWNPGALAWVSQPELTATHFVSVVDTSYDHAALVQPAHILKTQGGMGVSIQYSRTNNFDEFDLNGNKVGTVANYDVAALVGYGFKIKENFSLGLNVKGFGSRLATFEARGFAVDLGVQSEILKDRLVLGIAFLDMGSMQAFDKVADPLPTLMRLGLQGLVLQGPDGQVLGTIEVDRPWTTSDSIITAFGLEYWYQGGLAFRAGYRAGVEAGNLTLGLGYRWSGLSFDYAYVPLGDLGVTHRLTVSAELGTVFDQFFPYKPRDANGLKKNGAKVIRPRKEVR